MQLLGKEASLWAAGVQMGATAAAQQVRMTVHQSSSIDPAGRSAVWKEPQISSWCATVTAMYVPCRGLSPALARQVAEELTAKDVIRAHARDELGIDIDELANPWQVGEGRKIMPCGDAWVVLVQASPHVPTNTRSP
jgi:hypothetical protein